MREGKCKACNQTLPTVELAGFNVRLGVIEEAICHPCLRFYEDTRNLKPYWYSRVSRRVVRQRAKKRANEIYDNLPWGQLKIVTENSEVNEEMIND